MKKLVCKFAISAIISLIIVVGFAPESFAANANLFVSAENSQFDNYMSGPQVIEVVVIDSDINDTDEAKGEPDVTVNGKILRMVQAVDGNWYGYFADKVMAQTADATTTKSGEGLDFGTVCTSFADIIAAEGFVGVELSDTAGVALGATSCDGAGPNPLLQNVLREEKNLNTLEPKTPGLGGQIGIDEDSWPFIQLYFLSPTGNVVVQYNKGGGAQTTTLTFDTVDQFAGIKLDRSVYSQGSQVHATITDLWLNIDPTDEDSWTFGTGGTSTNYQVFDENGRTVGDTSSNTDSDLTDALGNLMCEDNCILLINTDVQGKGAVLTLQDNDDSEITPTADDGDPQNPSSWETIGGNISGDFPVTITELGPNSGVFATCDESRISNLVITDSAEDGMTAIVDYNESPQVVLISTASGGGGGVCVIPPEPRPEPTPLPIPEPIPEPKNANLFVLTPNPNFPKSFFGPDVVTVQVIDSDIDDIDEAKGEPDVTVNGKIIRMTQAVDGNWYGYFADKDMAIEADKNPDDDLEFGIVCTNTEDITAAENFININLSDTNGVTFGAITCDGTGADSTLQNVLKDVKDLNPGGGTAEPGQIGVEPTAWAFSQLYSFSDERPVVVQYNKGGGAQTTTLFFNESEPPAPEPEPEPETSNGGDNQWDTRPTFGVSHEDRSTQVVETGFTFNANEYMLTDNHHTDFAEQEVEIGTTNSFSATVYADKKLKIQEFLFGIPSVGEAHLAELGVEVWYDNNGEIEDVEVVQNSDVIDVESLSVSHEMTKCLPTDAEAKCDTTTVSMTFLEPLFDKVMAVKAIDYALRDQRTFLNEGFDISGESQNPMLSKMIPSAIRNEGLIQVTQVAKYSTNWISDDGRMFEMNRFGSFKQINQSFERFQDTGNAFTRQHSGFGGIIAYEQNRALDIFDATKLISELPDSFGHYFEIHDRITDEMKQEMFSQEQIAKGILEEMDKLDRHY